MRTNRERAERVMQKAREEKARRARKIKLVSAVACPLAVVMTLGLVLFVPYQEGKTLNLAKYADSEYYSVIEKLGALTYGEPRKTNRFQKLFDRLFACGGADEGIATAPGTNENYHEVTDNQTQGVIEGDLFKRSDKYVYYLNESEKGDRYVLQAYSLAGDKSQKISEFTIAPEKNTSFRGYGEDRELYLSADCKTVTVVASCYDGKKGIRYTAVIGIDVSDPQQMREINRSYLSGMYVSSRTAGDSMLVVSNFAVDWNPDFSNEWEYLPQTGSLDAMQSLPLENIVCPEDTERPVYTVICTLDTRSFEVSDSVALLSFSDDVYVSQNNLYASRSVRIATAEGNDSDYRDASEIRRIAYSEGDLEHCGTYLVNGTILNRYCMDEYEGVLRVFTTAYALGDDRRSADFTCFQVQTGERIAYVPQFAPTGESVQSARFYGDTAYVCTAITHAELTDPVFAFDLSDYEHITYVDTGTIPGYSLSLTKFSGDTLLGIGYGERSNVLKVELYRENDAEVRSVAVYEKKNVIFSQKYKAYYIDRERGLIGLGVISGETSHYLVLRYDGYELVEIESVELEGDRYFDDLRACTVEGNLYLFGRKTFRVISV